MTRNTPHLRLAILLVLCLVAAACAWKPKSDQERVIAEAFHAIAANDWATFEKHLITPGELINRQQGVSPFERSQTFAGGVLAPEERKARRAQFDRAVAGGDGQIDFATAKIAGIREVESMSFELLTGEEVSYTVYIAVVKTAAGEQVDTLAPAFVLTADGSFWKILALDFGEEAR